MMIVFRASIPPGDRMVGLGIENIGRFGFTSVGNSIFVNPAHMTDTTKLMLPINCVMIGNQPLKVDKTEIDVREANFRFTAKITTEGPQKLGGESGFTVKTSKRGYD